MATDRGHCDHGCALFPSAVAGAVLQGATGPVGDRMAVPRVPAQCSGFSCHLPAATRSRLSYRRLDTGGQLCGRLCRRRGPDGLARMGNRFAGCGLVGSVWCGVCCQLYCQAAPGASPVLVSGRRRSAQHRQSRVFDQCCQLGAEQS